LGQSPFASQRSSDLLQLGAVDGTLFTNHEWWRLLVSQFLHVHFLHMLFNVVCIALIGTFAEQALGWYGVLTIYLLGGTAGQLVSVATSPTLVSSGASQALMALCGGAILTSGSVARLGVLAIVGTQAALDLYASGTTKIGHSVGFVAGLLTTIGFLLSARSSGSK
jgi:membrane associated rhomboid family serine protease